MFALIHAVLRTKVLTRGINYRGTRSRTQIR